MKTDELSQITNTESTILSLFRKLAKGEQRQVLGKMMSVVGLLPWDIVTIPFKQAGKKQKDSSRKIAEMIEKDRYGRSFPNRRH